MIFNVTGHEKLYGDWWREAQSSRTSQHIQIGNMSIWVNEKVFSPDPTTTHSVQMLLDTMPDMTGKRVLDIGTGTGVLAIKAAFNGAKEVVATEVDDDAIENARRNVAFFELDNCIQIKRQDRFEELGKFDAILMNIIFANRPKTASAWEQEKFNSLDLHRRLLKSLPDILESNGICTLGFASFGDIGGLAKLLTQYSYTYSIQSQKAFEVNWYNITLSL